MLCLSELKVAEEEHMQSTGVFDLELVCICLRLPHLLFRVVHRPLQYIDGLREQRHIQSFFLHFFFSFYLHNLLLT